MNKGEFERRVKMSKRHTYLVYENSFQADNRGEKRFEYRRENEEINVGDTLELIEITEKDADTGGVLTVEITHIQYGGEYSIPDGFMIMSIKLAKLA